MHEWQTGGFAAHLPVMATVQWWAERVDVLLASTHESCVSLWRLHADLGDAEKRPDALKRSDISSMRKYYEKNIDDSVDLGELEKVRGTSTAFRFRSLACLAWSLAMFFTSVSLAVQQAGLG
jgi:hypothetical protein